MPTYPLPDWVYDEEVLVTLLKMDFKPAALQSATRSTVWGAEAAAEQTRMAALSCESLVYASVSTALRACG